MLSIIITTCPSSVGVVVIDDHNYKKTVILFSFAVIQTECT